MKKYIVFFTLLGLIFIVFPVFAGGGAEDSSVSEEPVTISLWHLWGGSRTELIDALLVKFQEKYPNVEFDSTFTPPNELNKKIIQAAGTGTLPDVFSMNTGWYKTMEAETSLQPLDDFLSNDGITIEEILVAAEADRSYYNGSVYSLPNVNAGAQGLFFYNRDLMKQAGLDPDADAPSNWDEFVAVSKKMVSALNGSGPLEIIAWDPNQMAGQPAVITFSYGVGSPTVSADGTRSLMNSRGVIETARKFDAYVEEVYGSYGGYEALIEWYARVAGVDTGAAQVQAFAKGNQGFYVSGSWTIGQVRSANADMDFGILPVPGFNGAQGGIAKDGWSYAMNPNAENKEIVWEFIKFMTLDAEGNGWFCIQQSRPCPIAAVNDDPSYQTMGTMWANLVISMNKDVVPQSVIYQDIVKPWLRDFPNLRLQGLSVEESMESIHKKFQDYLDDIYG